MAAPKGNDYAKGNPGGGRPTLYKPEYAEMAFNICLLGSTDEDLASIFDVSESTITLWKNEHKEFYDALKRGKSEADAKVAASLFNCATGFERTTVEETRAISNIDGVDTEIVTTKETKQYIPPNTTAQIFWLKNRNRKNWRDKVEIDSTVRTHENTLEDLE